MNIEFANAVRLNAAKAYEPPAASKKGAQADSKTPRTFGRETVEISDSSSSVRKVVDKIQEFPEVRIELVEKIRERIKHNDYPLDNRLYRALQKMLVGNII